MVLRSDVMRYVPHLYFRGGCEAALIFYTDCGLGAITSLQRFGSSPLADRWGPDWRGKVLHAVFEGPGLKLYAGDGPDSEPMKGAALLIENIALDPATALFARLSDGGRITVPFALQPWGDVYGNFTDRFGVQWAMNAPASNP